MNRIIMIIIAAVAMSANCYGKKSARITYDERPENDNNSCSGNVCQLLWQEKRAYHL